MYFVLPDATKFFYLSDPTVIQFNKVLSRDRFLFYIIRIFYMTQPVIVFQEKSVAREHILPHIISDDRESLLVARQWRVLPPAKYHIDNLLEHQRTINLIFHDLLPIRSFHNISDSLDYANCLFERSRWINGRNWEESWSFVFISSAV